MLKIKLENTMKLIMKIQMILMIQKVIIAQKKKLMNNLIIEYLKDMEEQIILFLIFTILKSHLEIGKLMIMKILYYFYKIYLKMGILIMRTIKNRLFLMHLYQMKMLFSFMQILNNYLINIFKKYGAYMDKNKLKKLSWSLDMIKYWKNQQYFFKISYKRYKLNIWILFQVIYL